MTAFYRKTERPRRPWRPADHQEFDAIIKSLKLELDTVTVTDTDEHTRKLCSFFVVKSIFFN